MPVQRLFPRELFKSKTVFVTGGGSGINLGVAKNFAALGAKVAICGRTQSKLDAAAEELRVLGAQVCPVTADVRDIAALMRRWRAAATSLVRSMSSSAALRATFSSPAERLSTNGFKSVVDIDLVGSFNSARAAFEQFKRTGGA